MSFVTEVANLLTNPQTTPESVERALEGFSLRTERQALEAIRGFSSVLSHLPDAVKKTAAMRDLIQDPFFSECESRMKEIDERLSALSPTPAA